MSDRWDSSRVRERDRLTLSEQERAAAAAKLVPSPDGDGYAADGVFEGGGVLGIAFLGAVRCCDDLGIRWKHLAGTSAGAITAALLVSRLGVDDIERLIGSLDFRRFVGRKTSRLLLDWNPTNDLAHPIWLFLKLLLAQRAGQYSTEPFVNWLESTLAQGGVRDFGPLIDRSLAATEVRSRLKVVVSDITHGRMLVLPDDLVDSARDTFSVSEAVRLSMSIPLFFEPGRLSADVLHAPDSRSERDAAVVVDGGILSNFPVWLFDADSGKRPRWPTFGFRLVDRASTAPFRVRGPLGLAIAMFETMRTAHDRRISAQKRSRTIDIDLTDVIVRHGIGVTSFTLPDEAKDALYAVGYESARNFFVNQWDWNEHLQARGFSPAAMDPGSRAIPSADPVRESPVRA